MQWAIIFLFLGWSIWLTDTNMKLRDNDLKYRYIKSENPKNEFINHLENVFEYDRDRKQIRNIRKKVKKYEDEVKKRAEMIDVDKQNEWWDTVQIFGANEKAVADFGLQPLVYQVTPERLELSTHWLRVNCSTNWATESVLFLAAQR